jgi:hypothetical protein
MSSGNFDGTILMYGIKWHWLIQLTIINRR